MVNNTTTKTPEEQLKQENEIMGKILIEIILHNDGISDERITRLFNQEDWKERVGFKVYDDGDIGWKKQFSWLSKPHKLFRNLKKKKEELAKENLDYQKKIEEQALKIEELSHYKERAEVAERDIEIHLEALETAGKERWTQKEASAKEISEKSKRLEAVVSKLNYYKEEFARVQKELEDKTKKLDLSTQKVRKQGEKIEKLESKLYYSLEKELPNLPKEQSKFKHFRTQVRTSFQKLIKSVKSQKRELIAKVEVKVK